MAKKSKTKAKAPEKQFTIKMNNNTILKTIIETLAAIVDEVKFVVDKKKLLIEAMDPSKICILQLTISRENFDNYECDTKCEICLNLEDFNKILKRSSKNSVELSFHESTQKIKIKMERKEEDNSRTRTFSLACIDSKIENAPLENLLIIDYDTTWNIDTEILIEAIKDAEIYSEVLNMEITEEKLTMTAIGQIGELEYELLTEDLLEASISERNAGSFSCLFLKAIMKIAPITEQLEISLKTDYPLNMKFDILEGGKLNYFIAPRVEDDNDFEDVEEIDITEVSIDEEKIEEEEEEE